MKYLYTFISSRPQLHISEMRVKLAHREFNHTNRQIRTSLCELGFTKKMVKYWAIQRDPQERLSYL